MVYKFFDKKTESGVNVTEKLTEELYKPVIKKLNRRKPLRGSMIIFGLKIQL